MTDTSSDTKTTPRLGQGDIHLKMGETEYTLRPTLKAVQVLCRRHDNLARVIKKVTDLDFEAIVDVIQVGIGPTFANAGQREKLAQLVYDTGLVPSDDGQTTPAVAAAEFINSLIRGGRPAPNSTGGTSEGN